MLIVLLDILFFDKRRVLARHGIYRRDAGLYTTKPYLQFNNKRQPSDVGRFTYATPGALPSLCRFIHPTKHNKTRPRGDFLSVRSQNLQDHQSSRSTAQTKTTFPAFRLACVQQSAPAIGYELRRSLSNKSRETTYPFLSEKKAFVPGGLR